MGALVLKSAILFFVWKSTCNMQFGKIADMGPIMDFNFIGVSPYLVVDHYLLNSHK